MAALTVTNVPAALRPLLAPALERSVAKILAGKHAAERAPIVTRLATDLRMSAVWRELARRDRKTGKFLHPARPPASTHQRGWADEEAQADAVGEALFVAYAAAVDVRKAGKIEDVDAVRGTILAEIATLYGVAAELVRSVEEAPAWWAAANNPEQVLADVAALRRVAGWKAGLAESLRTKDDSLTVQNNTHDLLTRGVQFSITAFLQERFGSPLYSTGVTMVAVSLGLDKVPNLQTSRSVFSKRNGL